VPRHAGSTSVIVFCVVQIIFNFCQQLRSRWKSDVCLCHISDWEWPQEYDPEELP
jgi:hypothetical protein